MNDQYLNSFLFDILDLFLETVPKGDNSDREADEEDSWDTMFDDDGECVDPSAMDEVCPPYIMLVNLKAGDDLEFLPPGKIGWV